MSVAAFVATAGTAAARRSGLSNQRHHLGEAGRRMQGVEHLGQYVFEMTKAKVEDMKRGGQTLPATEQEAQGRVEGEDEEEEDDDVAPAENLVVDGEGEVEMGDAGVL